MPGQLVTHGVIVVVKRDVQVAAATFLEKVPVVADHLHQPCLDLWIYSIGDTTGTLAPGFAYDKILADKFTMRLHDNLFGLFS